MSAPASNMGAQMRPVLARLAQGKGRSGRGSSAKKLPDQISVWKIVRGDKVHVLAGKEAGKQGTVLKVYRKEQKVLIEAINLVKKHVAPRGPNQQGGIITKAAPIHVSNVALVDPVQNVPTKVKFAFLEDGTKVRISKKSGAIIPKPEILKKRRHDRPVGTLETDTTPEVAGRATVSAADSALHDALRRLTVTGPGRPGSAGAAPAGPAATPAATQQPQA